jgi:hypothetical protein
VVNHSNSRLYFEDWPYRSNEACHAIAGGDGGRLGLRGGFEMASKHNYNFIEEYDGLIGFGLDRKTDECTMTFYLQKFAEDRHIQLIRERMSDGDLEALFNQLTRLLKRYLSEEEYHKFFLKDDEGEM